MSHERILVVDDDREIARLLRGYLEQAGYGVQVAYDGVTALAMVREARPDVLLLDLMLPDMDGWAVTRRIRSDSTLAATPIIMLTARVEDTDKILGLELGADDYVTKPFGMNELLARLRAALRHRLQEQGAEPVFEQGGIKVDLARRQVWRGGEQVNLSPREYDLLRQLVIHAGKVLTHQHLLREVWGPAHLNDTPYLRVYVGQLRQKLEADPANPRLIATEPGVGYRLKDGG